MSQDYKWSLDELYTSIHSSEFLSDMDNLQKSIEKINEFAVQNLSTTHKATDKLIKYIELLTDVNNYSLVVNYLSLSLATNSKDFELKKLIGKVEKILSELVNATVLFNEFLLKLDNFEDVLKDEKLSTFEYFLKEQKRLAQYNLSRDEEFILSKVQLTGSTAWSKLRSDLISNLSIDVEIDGKVETLPFPAVRNLAYNTSQQVRKNAFYAELDAYKRIDVPVSACLNNIKGEVITTTNLRNTTPLKNTLLHSRMNEDILNAMLSSMEESLPTLRKYFLHKAKLLNHSNGLPFYDLFAPIGKSSKTFTYEEAIAHIVDTLNKFHSSLGSFVQFAVDKKWVDVYPSDGKRDGAFCSNIQQIKESRVLTNFSGTFSCMGTLAHELGHAYHGNCLKDEHILNTDYPMPIAETASILFETLVMEDALQSANEDEIITILDSSLTDSTQVIVDILSRYIFETNVFKERENGDLSVDELCDLMVDAQKQTYGDGLSEYHPYMWLCKPHYYSASRNFYNFPYAFGLLFAKGLYAYSKTLNDNEKFIEIYNELLSQTGKNDLYDLCMKVGIDISKKEFWKQSLKSIEDEVELFLKLEL